MTARMEDIFTRLKQRLPFEGEFTLSGIRSVTDKALDQLNDEEKKELQTFNNRKRREEYISSRLALKLLADRLGITGKDLMILKDELGQPYGLANGQTFFVSIAHTDERVFCGITENTAIGVDLEPTDRRVPQQLQRRIMHPNEDQFFKKMGLIRLWTLKEAFIKLRGQGLRLNMNQVQLQQKGDDFFVEINNDKRAKICSFQASNNWLAIAYYQ